MQPDSRHFGTERLAVDRLCLARLWKFAADRSILLGP
jgi:hypothetical protein